MGSKPITAIAKMKSYENTVAKKLGDPTDPPKSRTEDVQDDKGYLEEGGVSFSFGPDKVSIDREEKMRDLTDADVWNMNRNNVQGEYTDFKSYQTAAQRFRDEQGESFTPAQIGTGQFTEILNRQPGDILASFAYAPKERQVDTNTVSEGRKISRILKGDARRATKMSSKVDRLERRRDRKKENSRAYDRLNRKLTNFQAVETGLNAQLDKNKQLIEKGVNPYSTGRSGVRTKATEDTQTRQDFELKYGGLKDTTPENITFYNNPAGSSSNATSRAVAGVLDRMFNNENKSSAESGVGKKMANSPVYKMKGFGTKNK